MRAGAACLRSTSRRCRTQRCGANWRCPCTPARAGATRWCLILRCDGGLGSEAQHRTHALQSRRIVLFGGWDGHQDLADLWVYDVALQQWLCISGNTHEQVRARAPPGGVLTTRRAAPLRARATRWRSTWRAGACTPSAATSTCAPHPLRAPVLTCVAGGRTCGRSCAVGLLLARPGHDALDAAVGRHGGASRLQGVCARADSGVAGGRRPQPHLRPPGRHERGRTVPVRVWRAHHPVHLRSVRTESAPLPRADSTADTPACSSTTWAPQSGASCTTVARWPRRS
jgi:hypothetical protein